MRHSKSLTRSRPSVQHETMRQAVRVPLELLKSEPQPDISSLHAETVMSKPASALTVSGNWLSHRPSNRLLANLPLDVWMRLQPHMGQMSAGAGHVLIEQGQRVERVFFPLSGLVSQIISAPDGSQVSTALLGREGICGLPEGLNNTSATTDSFMQVAGTVCWLPAEIVQAEFKRNETLQCWLLRYMEWQTVQSTQNVLCNRLHSIEERLARWLLHAQEKVGPEFITVTHKNLSALLGTLRCPITLALGRFEKMELIHCARGRLLVLNAEGLKKLSCRCHDVLQQQEKSRRLDEF